MIYLFSSTPAKDQEVLHIELVKIHFLEFMVPEFSTFDAIVFTSKNGVKALGQRSFAWKNVPCYAIGEATKKEIESFSGKTHFCSTLSYGNEFAGEITSLLKGKKVLFVRAREVAFDLGRSLREEGVCVEELIAYESICLEKEFIKPQKNSVLIFTAPSMVKCFMKHFSFESSWKIICIGKKTAHALPENVSYILPQKQSIEACVKLAK